MKYQTTKDDILIIISHIINTYMYSCVFKSIDPERDNLLQNVQITQK